MKNALRDHTSVQGSLRGIAAGGPERAVEGSGSYERTKMHPRRTCRLTCAAILWATLCVPTLARAQQSVIPLYPGAAPGSEHWDWSERAVTTRDGLPMVQNVVRPELL